jgi:dihydroxy-acid dehydratase
MEQNIRPLDILTQKSLDNAFILDMAMGGSTNTVLHGLALAHSAGIPYDLDRLNRISRSTPNICKIAPSRPEVHVEDVHRAGGIGTILKEIAAHANTELDLNLPTVAGMLADYVNAAQDADGDVIRHVDRAFSQTGGLAARRGQRRRGGGDPLRRSARGAGNAGDALAHIGYCGGGGEGRPDHRRPVFGRHARALHRARGP